MRIGQWCVLGFALAATAWAQDSGPRRPRFEEYPVKRTWSGTPSNLALTTSSERMFRTTLRNAAKEPPNFAGHYRFVIWGCGSECAAGAVIDLATGEIFQPPLATKNGTGWERWIISPGMFDGADIKFRVESRLVIVLSGLNDSERFQKNVPDTYYFLWEENQFRQLLYVSGKAISRK